LKPFLKTLARILSRILILPFVLLSFVRAVLLGSSRAFQGDTQYLSLVPGVLGEYLRREYLRFRSAGCGRHSVVSFGTIFSSDRVKIGERAYLGAYCIIGTAEIGENSLIASRVSIISGRRQHDISSVGNSLVDQPGTLESILIGRECWIGEGAIIAANIGDNAVVGAGSVVIEPVAANTVVAGNPARLIRHR